MLRKSFSSIQERHPNLAEGFEAIRYPTTTRTNWHYECARESCRRQPRLAVAVGVKVNSTVDEIVEQSRLEWLQRRLLIAEELRLGLAHACGPSACGSRRRSRGFSHARLSPNRRRACPHQARALVIDEVLQVVGVAVLLRRAQQDHGLADEDAALGLLRRHVARSRARSRRAAPSLPE